MGWLFYHKDSKQKPIDNLRGELFGAEFMAENDYSIVAEANSKGVCYFAMKRPVRASDEQTYVLEPAQTHVVVALVILHKSAKDYYNFGYKDMDEFSGPCEAEAPASFIKKLTPLIAKASDYVEGRYDGNTSAARWRQACLDNAAKKKSAVKLTHGLKVKLPYKLSFKSGEVDTFEVVVWQGRRARTYFRASFGLVRLRPNEKRDLVLA